MALAYEKQIFTQIYNVNNLGTLYWCVVSSYIIEPIILIENLEIRNSSSISHIAVTS